MFRILDLRVLSTQEEQEICERFHTTKYQLPRIKLTDPLLRFIPAESRELGRVIEITRLSITAGEAVVYRLLDE